MCTQRWAAVSEHRNRNFAIVSPTRYHHTNFVCNGKCSSKFNDNVVTSDAA